MQTYEGQDLSKEIVEQVRDEMNVFQHTATAGEFRFAFEEKCTA